MLELYKDLQCLEEDLAKFEIERLLNKKYDQLSCGLSIQSGAGGIDAQDWVTILFRMYTRFAERNQFKVIVMEEVRSDHGLKSVELRIEGPYAYGYLAGEKGTHRLVRQSPYNAQNKRQTSFAGVETWPILEDTDIYNEDIILHDKVITAAILYSVVCVKCLFFLH